MEAVQRRVEMPVGCVAPAHRHTPLSHQTSLTTHGIKGKIIKNFKTVTAGHPTKHGVLLSVGLRVGLHRWRTPEASPVVKHRELLTLVLNYKSSLQCGLYREIKPFIKAEIQSR